MVATLYHLNHAVRFHEILDMAGYTIAKHGKFSNVVVMIGGQSFGLRSRPSPVSIEDTAALLQHLSRYHTAVGTVRAGFIDDGSRTLRVYYAADGESYGAEAPIYGEQGAWTLGEWQDISVPEFFAHLYDKPECKGA